MLWSSSKNLLTEYLNFGFSFDFSLSSDFGLNLFPYLVDEFEIRSYGFNESLFNFLTIIVFIKSKILFIPTILFLTEGGF